MDKVKLIFHYWCKGTMKAVNKTTYCSKLPTTSELLEEVNALLIIHSVFDPNVDKASVTVYEAYQSGDNTEAELLFPVVTVLYTNDDKVMTFTEMCAEEIKSYFSA